MKVDPKLVREWEAKGLIELLPASAVRTRMHYIRLPLCPSTNNLFANAGSSRVKTKKYKDWIQNAGLSLIGLGIVPSPVRVIISVCGKVDRARDLDNFCKPILDLLVACCLIEGDSLMHVHTVVVNYEPSEEPGKVVVSVCPVTA